MDHLRRQRPRRGLDPAGGDGALTCDRGTFRRVAGRGSFPCPHEDPTAVVVVVDDDGDDDDGAASNVVAVNKKKEEEEKEDDSEESSLIDSTTSSIPSEYLDDDDDSDDNNDNKNNNNNQTNNNNNTADDEDAMIPREEELGGRTVSTHLRLRRQGLTRNASGEGFQFAVQSIRRGSTAWQSLLQPFVSDLAFRSLIQSRQQSDVTFRPYSCPTAAVLFVDLSGYSRIAAALSHRGAHFLSTVVNRYLAQLLRIIQEYGGDVVKFAGDAVLVVWEGESKQAPPPPPSPSPRINRSAKQQSPQSQPQPPLPHRSILPVVCAAHCALEMQRRAASYPVDGTDLSFEFHCGLTCGPLDSEIFVAPTHVNMPRLYHSVGGATLNAIGTLVDQAQAGELCVDDTVRDCLGSLGTYRDVTVRPKEKEKEEEHQPAAAPKGHILTSLDFDGTIRDQALDYIERTMAERLTRRNHHVEEDFIHPSVLKLLSHGGLSPTQIAQMRNLCVLFIAMTSQGSSCNWLMEVQGVLDKNRCPIVQIIDDDKGVHIVAAINLYETIPEANVLGLDICRELVEQEVGCAIGMACGTTFCGVTGSNLACRWDITGPPAVRAARLMQYALQRNLPVAIDESVYLDSNTGTKMKLAEEGVTIKGSPEPCSVYTLSEAKVHSAFRVLETVHGRCHDTTVGLISDWIRRPEQSRCAVLVKGPPFAGKKIVCQRAAGLADLVPFLHVCDKTFGLLQLARTIALWFQYNQHDYIVRCAEHIIDLMDKRKWRYVT